MSHPWEEIRMVDAIAPTVLGSSLTGTYVSLKNVNKAYIMVHLCQASTDIITIYPYQATAIAGTGAKVFSLGLPCWLSNGCSSDETLTKQTTGVNFSFSSSTGDKIAIIEVQPGQMDLANSFDCINIRTSAGTTDSLISAVYYLDMRYQEADTPTVFAD